MKSGQHSNTDTPPAKVKRAYQPPRLIRFGLVRELTGKPGSFSDSNPNHDAHPVGN